MFSFSTMSVRPKLPEAIMGLKDLSQNLWFSWNYQARMLFIKINNDLWEKVNHNPVKFLLSVHEEELEEAAQNPDYLSQYNEVMEQLERYKSTRVWFKEHYADLCCQTIAYFSAEFGLHESHPIYSGGLGLLAGDHLKAASDLGLPFVGVGLLYKQGYFEQSVNRYGWQEAYYPFHNFFERPITPAAVKDGEEMLVTLDLPGRQLYVKVWLALVGTVRLVLLDTDLSLNEHGDRGITGQLYGGDSEMRLKQEMVLGIGGVRALRALGINPGAWHINEGHAAFLCLERIREYVSQGLNFDVAREAVKACTLFTTHTPVPAGHDIFAQELVEKYFYQMYRQMGLGSQEFQSLARDASGTGMFNMTLLGMGLSSCCNGVSRLHGVVSRQMFSTFYPEIPVEEIPISHITNGVHTSTWLAQDIKDLYTLYLGTDWQDRLTDKALWKKIYDLPDTLLWGLHQTLKEKFINFARQRLVQQRRRNQEPVASVGEVKTFLSPEVLTIGFARRFATYKRATLLLRDKERLNRLVNNPEMPVQFIFAGKAHPADKAGQEMIKAVYDVSRLPEFQGKIIFLEGYDIHMARHLLQGVDVWLNTPRRPMEASGTSGQKAAANGVLNISVADGWWPEAFNGENGFTVGEKHDYNNEELQDRDDCYSLFATLEGQVAPLYYKKENSIPREWVKMMKTSLATISPVFNTHRMVQEYTERYYSQLINRGHYFSRDNFQVAQRIRDYKRFMVDNWCQVKIKGVETSARRAMDVGEMLTVKAWVHLGAMGAKDVEVEVVYGDVTEQGLKNISISPMQHQENQGDTLVYLAQVILPQGTFGFTVRVRPQHPDFLHRFELPLVRWADRF